MVLGVPILAVLYLLLSEFVNKRLQKKGTVVAAEGPAAAGPEGEQPPPYRESLPEKQIGQAASAEKSEGEAAVLRETIRKIELKITGKRKCESRRKGKNHKWTG